MRHTLKRKVKDDTPRFNDNEAERPSSRVDKRFRESHRDSKTRTDLTERTLFVVKNDLAERGTLETEPDDRHHGRDKEDKLNSGSRQRDQSRNNWSDNRKRPSSTDSPMDNRKRRKPPPQPQPTLGEYKYCF